MKRRTLWIAVGAVVAVTVVVVGAWMLASRSSTSEEAGGGTSAEPTATPTPTTLEAAQALLDDHLDECTKPSSSVPTGCGIQIPWAADLTTVSDIRYRIEQAPTLTLAESGFRADDGILVATVTGTGHDGTTQSLTYRTQNWSLRGDLVFTADELALSVW